MNIKPYLHLFAFTASLFGLVSCGTNPVTGDQELQLVSRDQEISIGNQQYSPTRQAQGGDYVADPQLVGYVKQVGAKLARVSDRKLPYEFVVINDSTPNAWALPGGKIAINRGLLTELENEAELAAVLGHEIVHSAARHGAQGMERGILLQGAVLATGIALHDKSYGDLAVGAASVGAALVNQKYGRDAERESDEYGIKYMVAAGYDPQAAVTLQEKFVKLAQSKQGNWLEGLFASHPPSQERVVNNRAFSSRYPQQQLTLGESSFRQATARLQRVKPAYDWYDRSKKALAEKDSGKAMLLIEKAIKLEPEEALFHELKGDILAGRTDKNGAKSAYDQAIRRNGEFYRFYLKRGELYRETGQADLAERDLQRGNSLLPTATGYRSLGLLAEQKGQRQQAVDYYRQAAGSTSEAGRQAARALQKLEQSGQLHRRIEATLRLDRRGRLIAVLANRGDLPLGQIKVSLYQRQRGGGQALVGTRLLRERLNPFQTLDIDTGVGPLSPSALGGYRLVVHSAQPLR
jgi:predicted Zn-dependent protease